MVAKWWQEKSEHARYLRNRSTARSFIRKQATFEDLQELEKLIAERKKTSYSIPSKRLLYYGNKIIFSTLLS